MGLLQSGVDEKCLRGPYAEVNSQPPHLMLTRSDSSGLTGGLFGELVHQAS